MTATGGSPAGAYWGNYPMFVKHAQLAAKSILGLAAAGVLVPAAGAQQLVRLRLPQIAPTREVTAFARPPIHVVTTADLSAPPTSAFTPAMIRHAYGFDLVANQGAGQTIAVIDAYDDANIESDLATFSSQFGLPACSSATGCFTKLYATGSQPSASAQWTIETALDVEWAHAIAPQANIILVEANSYALSDLLVAVDLAVTKGASVVSMSWTTSEFSGERSMDTHFLATGVTFLAASGDSGAGVNYPAASPDVISVGGTSLTLNAQQNYQSEAAWSGSGGGVSAYENEPVFQEQFGVPNDPGGYRVVPDVSLDANPGTGFAVYNSIPYQNAEGWFQVGGTSASTPQWAAAIAIVNSMRAAAHKASYSGAAAPLYPMNTRLDSLTFNPINRPAATDCRMVCHSIAGYDIFTGLGSPQVKNLIPTLVARP
ncbi:MAG: S53 family peptidase [Candidatus Acidiferrales bacterium]